MDELPAQPPIISAKELMPPKPQVKKSWLWLWLPLLMIILGGVTAFAWQTYQLKQEIGQIKASSLPSPIIVSPQPSVIVSPTPDPTVSWPIYTNKLQGYSLKYPADWQMDSRVAEVNINSKLVLSKKNYQIVIYANLEGFGGTRSQVASTPITVAGLNLFKREIGDNHYSQTGSWEISANDSSPTFSYQGKTYEIYLTYPLPEKNSPEYKAVLNTFDQILSTFKFTDEVQTTACGGWDTSGEVVCECSGKLNKPSCLSNTVCDSGIYTCSGQCGNCCYNGIADNYTIPRCSIP